MVDAGSLLAVVHLDLALENIYTRKHVHELITKPYLLVMKAGFKRSFRPVSQSFLTVYAVLAIDSWNYSSG